MFNKDYINEDQIKETKFNIPFVRPSILSAKIKSKKKEIDLIEKKRALKRWKQTLNFYSLHPEKYKFGFKNFK